MTTQRLKEMAAMLMIGDGLLGVLEPQRHVLLWRSGPRFWERMMDPFLDHPRATRLLGLAGLIAGVWLAARQTQQFSGAQDRLLGFEVRHAARRASSLL